MACWNLPIIRQIWVSIAVLICQTTSGIYMGYTATLIAALQAKDSPIKADLQELTWLASVLGPAYIVGQLTSALLMDLLGRKKTLLLVSPLGICGWILIYFGSSYKILLIGRILTGIAVGYIASFGAIVIGEYTSPQHRGMFLNLKMASYNLGSTIAHICDNYVHWRSVALIGSIPGIISFLITCTIPESPPWLALNQKIDKCREDFIWLRGRSESATWEMEELITAQKQIHPVSNKKQTIFTKFIGLFKKFTRRDFLRCLLAFSFALVLLETSGRHFFSAYAVKIMTDITGTKTEQRNYTLILDVLTTASAIASAALVKTLRRRTLLFASGISSLLVLTVTCILLYLISNEIISRSYQLLPICSLILYFVLLSLGCTPIIVALKGEIFPLHHRSGGTIMASFINFLIITCLLHVTPYLLVNLKVYGTFALFGIIMALALVALYFTLPETKDRTLQEIEDYFHHGRFLTNSLPSDKPHLEIMQPLESTDQNK